MGHDRAYRAASKNRAMPGLMRLRLYLKSLLSHPKVNHSLAKLKPIIQLVTHTWYAREEIPSHRVILPN